jgi:secreted PhoX family phosphatase
LTNEEATDIVNRTGTAWPATPAFGSNPEQAGVVVALDVASGSYKTVYGLGRMNHENSVAIPGYDEAVLVTGDDTFSAPASQLYMYLAADADGVWNDSGHLYGFVSDDPAINDYGDLTSSNSVSGTFLQVPDAVADGDQNGLEAWSNANNVFQFIRIEDLAYDRNDSHIVYFADTGEPRAVADPATGRLRRGAAGTEGLYPNGRIFKMVLDPEDPTVVTDLSVLIDADAAGYRNVTALHQPDNVETTASSILITEDPGGHNRFAGATNARLWRYDLATGEMTAVAVVSAATDDWESSGVVDASEYFGDGAFLINVQAHNVFVETAPLPAMPTVTQKREGGQLLLIRIDGA